MTHEGTFASSPGACSDTADELPSSLADRSLDFAGCMYDCIRSRALPFEELSSGSESWTCSSRNQGGKVTGGRPVLGPPPLLVLPLPRAKRAGCFLISGAEFPVVSELAGDCVGWPSFSFPSSFSLPSGLSGAPSGLLDKRRVWRVSNLTISEGVTTPDFLTTPCRGEKGSS